MTRAKQDRNESPPLIAGAIAVGALAACSEEAAAPTDGYFESTEADVSKFALPSGATEVTLTFRRGSGWPSTHGILPFDGGGPSLHRLYTVLFEKGTYKALVILEFPDGKKRWGQRSGPAVFGRDTVLLDDRTVAYRLEEGGRVLKLIEEHRPEAGDEGGELLQAAAAFDWIYGTWQSAGDPAEQLTVEQTTGAVRRQLRRQVRHPGNAVQAETVCTFAQLGSNPHIHRIESEQGPIEFLEYPVTGIELVFGVGAQADIDAFIAHENELIARGSHLARIRFRRDGDALILDGSRFLRMA
jgi:hypothetical protein